MNREIYKSYISNYLDSLAQSIEVIKSIHIPEFVDLQIDCSLINESYFQECVGLLKQNGVQKSSAVLYYFSFLEKVDVENIKKEVSERKKYKSSDNEYLALPQVNKQTDLQTSNILYVGKTNKNFPARFKQHLGINKSSTYALQLAQWASAIHLKLILSYAIVDLKLDKIDYLESLETALHGGLKPVLGRVGR
jgi:hypothetical protein